MNRGSRSNSFKEFVLEQLSELDEVTPRYMFGDWGLYCGELFFGIVADGRLYFKTDETTRPRYLKSGMGPFRPNPKQTLIRYYEVPVEILEDRRELVLWARRAVRCQRDAAAAVKRAPRRKERS